MSQYKDERTVVCNDCEEPVRLSERPYNDTPFVLECDCRFHEIDVSDAANGHSLFEPRTGRWSSFDEGSNIQDNHY